MTGVWRRAIIALEGCLAVAALRADPRPSSLFSDYAVLQRDVAVPVWGTATPGERIAVRYRDHAAATIADRDGRWRIYLPPMPACASADLVIEGDDIFTAHHVAVGDVWLLTGQSNMEFPLIKAADSAEAIAAANLPWLRHLKVPHRVSDQAEDTFPARWIPSSPQTASTFSAVGFFFARHLYRDDTVPVGLLNVSRGGTTIETWMSPRAVQQAAYGQVIQQRWQAVMTAFPRLERNYQSDLAAWERAQARAEAMDEPYKVAAPPRPSGPGQDEQLSGLYNGMMAPVMPFAVRGVLWYQGESNEGRPDEYADLLAALIEDWRHRLGNPVLPFLVVQLPNYIERHETRPTWARIRAAQAKVAQDDPHTYLAVTIDIGNPHDKHPRNKTEVGRRLALLARRHVFGQAIAADAPTVKSARRKGQHVVLEFETEGAELVIRAAAPEPPAFEIAAADSIFVPAAARLTGGNVILDAERVREPRFVRYLFQNDPAPCLFTQDGLPVGPFAIEVGQPPEGK